MYLKKAMEKVPWRKRGRRATKEGKRKTGRRKVSARTSIN
jgi:hypothetical protein